MGLNICAQTIKRGSGLSNRREPMNLFAGRATNVYRNHYHPKERAMSRKIILSLVAAATLAGAALSSGSADAMIRQVGGHPNGHPNFHWRFHEHRHFVRWHN